MLTSQSRKLTIELKDAERDYADALRRKEKLEDRIVELKLQSSSAEKELKDMQERRDNAMVECDMLKLESNHLKKALSGKASEVYTWEYCEAVLKAFTEGRAENVARTAW